MSEPEVETAKGKTRHPFDDLPSLGLPPSLHASTSGVESMGALGVFFARLFLLLSPSLMLGAFLGTALPANIVFVLPAFAVLLLAPRKLLLGMPISPALLMLLSWIVMSYLWSVSRVTTLFSLREDLSPVLGLIIVVGLMPVEETVKWLVRGFKLMIVASILVVLAVPETRVSSFEGVEVDAWEAWFISKNQLGRSMLVAYLTLLVLDRTVVTRVLGLLGAVVLVLGSSSATAVAGCLFVTAIWLWAKQFQRVGREWTTTYVMASITAGIVGLVSVFVGAAWVVQVLGRDLSFSGRTGLWQPTLDLIAKQPLIGYGYRALFTPETQETLELWREIGFRASHSHNGPMEVTLGIGVIGLGLFFIFYVSTFAGALRYLKKSDVAMFGFVFLLLQLLVAFVEPVFLRDWLGVLVIIRILLLRIRLDERAERDAVMNRVRGRSAMTLDDYAAVESVSTRGRRRL